MNTQKLHETLENFRNYKQCFTFFKSKSATIKTLILLVTTSLLVTTRLIITAILACLA